MVRALILWLLIALPATAQDGREMRLQILYDHRAHVVGEMIALTIRAEYDATVNLSELNFPDSPDYDWIQLDRDQWYRERIKGRQWQIFQRRVAVYARHAGPLVIGPLTHDLSITGADNKWHEVSVEAPAITVDVQPFPADAPPLVAREVTVTDELSADPGKLTDGAVLIRRVTMRADGALPHQLPPRPDLREPWLISFTEPEQRSVERTPEGPISTVIWEWSLQPKSGEPAVLKAFAFPWLDTDSRQIEVAAMKPIPFGFASFAANIADAGQARVWTRTLIWGSAVAGLLAGLIVLFWGRRLRPPAAIRRGVMRWRPTPYVRQMRQAARDRRLVDLRRAAAAHLALRGHDPQGMAVLQPLDQQLYAPHAPGDFDADGFVLAVIRASRQVPGEATRWSISNTSPNRAASRITTG